MKAQVENHGSVFLFRPVDMEAEEWCDEHISSDRQSFGMAIVVEPRYISDLVMAFQNDGGIIE